MINLVVALAIFSSTILVAALVATVRRLIGSSWGTAVSLVVVLACGIFLGATVHTPGMYRAAVPTTMAATLFFLGMIVVYIESRRQIPTAPVSPDRKPFSRTAETETPSPETSAGEA